MSDLPSGWSLVDEPSEPAQLPAGWSLAETPAPKSSAVGDFVNRIGQRGWHAAGDMTEALGRWAKASGDFFTSINEKTYEKLTGVPMDPKARVAAGLPATNAVFDSGRSEGDRDLEAMQRFANELRSVGDAVQVDPARNAQLSSMVADATGTLVPTVPSAVIGAPGLVLSLAAIMQEGVRQYSIEQGDTPEIADAKARLAGAVGALTGLTPKAPVRAAAGVVERLATRAAEGAAVNTGQEALTEKLTEGKVDPQRLKGAAVLGATFGAGIALPEAVSARNTPSLPAATPKAAEPDAGAKPTAAPVAADPAEGGAAVPIKPAPAAPEGVDTARNQAPPALEPYRPQKGLDDHARGIETRFGDQLAADPEHYYQAYRAANTQGGVLRIDPDLVRPFSPDYQADAGANSRAVHEPASSFAKYVYARALHEGSPDQRVVFLAGGAGSGKSTATQVVPELLQGADLMVDGTMANYESSQAKIQQALDAGRKVSVTYVYADPRAAWRQAKIRERVHGRRVDQDTFSGTHLGSFITNARLAEHYTGNQNVAFKYVDNSGTRADIQPVTREQVLRKIVERGQITTAEAEAITREIFPNEKQTENDRPVPGNGADGAADVRPSAETGPTGPGDAGEAAPVGTRPGHGPGGGEGAAPGSRAQGANPVVEFPIERIVVNKDVRQFKSNADPKTGVVEKLGGKFEREPLTRQVLLWEKLSGEHEIITGRHKLDLAKRSDEKTIPAQILREADGWTLDKVRAVDAEVNIRGGHGQVKDFAQYFRGRPDMTAEQAAAKGLTGRAMGAAGWALGKDATPALWDLYANNQIPEGKAVAIARGAPGHEAAQASAIRQAAGKSAPELELYARNLARSSDRASSSQQLGFAGVAQDFADFEREASAVAKIQAQRIDEKKQLVLAAEGAARRPEAARKMGLPVNDPAALRARVDQLRNEITALENPDERTYQDLREAAGLPRQDMPPPEAAPDTPPPEDPNQAGMGFARRKAPLSTDQTDIFNDGALAGGETGGDTTFNLQGESAQDFEGVVDRKAAEAEARAQQAKAQMSLFRRERATSDEAAWQRYAEASPEDRAAVTAELAAARARWRAEAERIAPGLMARFRLKFGDPELLVQEGKVRPEELTGWEQAFYDGHERMLYLFDRALQENADYFTRLNLLHEMGHAHWDTLPRARQAELGRLWESEISGRAGPLFDGRKQLRAGVAQGIEADIGEWYAERVAWANHDWAQARAAGRDVRQFGPIARAAQEFRILLQQLRDWIGNLRRGDLVDVDFRQFLDQGRRFASSGLADRGLQLEGVAAAQRDFARRAPGSAHSAPNIAQRMRDAIDDTKSFLQRELTSRGHLPEEVYRARVERDGRVEAIRREMGFALRDLDEGVRAVYGGWSAVPPAEQVKINDVLGGRIPTTSLDARLQAPVAKMRAHVDALSGRLVREGVVSGALAGKVAGNAGFYLNRSYRKFDDPAWYRKVEPAVVNRAASFIRAEMRADVVAKLADADYRQACGWGPNVPAYRQDPVWEQFRQKHDANQALQPDEANVQGMLEYLLTKDVEGPEAFFKPGAGKDLTILAKRQDIAPEIRALLGEYQDPRVNYARSVAKMGQLLETHRLLKEARTAGLGKFFHEQPQPGAAVRLAAEGSKALAPLNGLFTSPEIAAAFHRAFDEGQPQNPAWRAYLALNGWVKTAKTVLHPITQVRNFVANFGFLVANGHYHAADGGAAVLQAMRAELGSTDQRARDYLTRLARWGIVGESAAAGEIREALRDAGVKMTGLEQWTDSLVTRAAKMPLRAAERLYRVNDELFKIYAFENEVRNWREALPTAPIEQVERIAAERVHNTLPTYSKVPLAVQRVRRAALLGSFVSFPAEVVRTGFHTVRYAMTDLRSTNPSVRMMGARRLAGVMAAAAVYPAATAVSRWLADVDQTDENDLRRFLPEWTRNSQLLYTAPAAGGRQSIVDLSYLDPWAYLRKPVLAAMHGEDLGDAVGAAATEAVSPFLGEGVLAKVLLDITRNQDDQGRKVYDPQAGPIERQLQKLAHVWQAAEPGFVTQGKRIVRAARGDVTASGRAYNLEDELLALTTGARSQSIDVSTAHHFQAGRFSGELNQATVAYRRVRDRQGATPDEIAAAKARFDQIRGRLFADLYQDTLAAQRLGISSAQVLANLKAAGLGRAEVVSALTGQVFPYIDRPVSKYEQLRRTLEEQRN